MKIRRSVGPDFDSKYEWPCFAQCGGSSKCGFFFEVFPSQGMIRSDSKVSLEDAEERAWNKLLVLQKCPLDHTNPNNLDRRDYKNGVAFCKGCGNFINPGTSGLQPTTNCCVCNIPSYHGQDKFGNWYCREHYKELSDENLNEMSLHLKMVLKNAVSDEDLNSSLKDVITHLAKSIKSEED